MRDHRLARGVERGVRRHPVRLAHAVDADAVRCRRLARLELRAEFTRDHAARLVDFHDPRAAKKLEVLVEDALGDVGAEAELLRVRVVREGLAHEAQILAERVSLDELLAIALRAFAARENAKDAVVRPTVGGKPNLLHRSPE